jgi:uncharacterized DUF497 family protein
MRFIVSERILKKLTDEHKVSLDEVKECFENREWKFVKDSREQHKSNPPTQWFISETHTGRRLKVVFIRMLDGSVEIKTTYEPSHTEENVYERKRTKP